MFAHTPISRRHFVGLSTSLILYPSCLSAAGSRSTIRFDVVSDTHLGYRDASTAESRWKLASERLQKSSGSFALHLGDIVDGGREQEYPKYLAIRNQVGKPVHEIPGNHDPEPLFQKHIRPEINLAVEHEWLRILLLNNARLDSHDGFITADQLQWLTEQCDLANKQEQSVIIAMHVPVHSNKHPDRGWYVKPAGGQVEFYKFLEQHSTRIIALFHGHFHNGIRGWDTHAPVHEICFPSTLYNLDRKLEAGGASGFNVPEFRPGVTHVTLQDKSMTLELQPLAGEERASKKLSI